MLRLMDPVAVLSPFLNTATVVISDKVRATFDLTGFSNIFEFI